MRFYDVTVNQSVPTEVNRGLTRPLTSPVKDLGLDAAEHYSVVDLRHIADAY
jgi:hypothetical protein